MSPKKSPDQQLPDQPFPERQLPGPPIEACRRFVEFLDACVIARRPLASSSALDSASPPDLEVRAHRDQCAPCAARWSETVLLEEAFAAWAARRPEAELTSAFADSILARLAAERLPANAGQTNAARPESEQSALSGNGARHPESVAHPDAPQRHAVRIASTPVNASLSTTPPRVQRAIVVVVASALAVVALMVATGRHTRHEDARRPSIDMTSQPSREQALSAGKNVERDTIPREVAPRDAVTADAVRNQTGRNQTGRNQTGRNQTGRNQTDRHDEPPIVASLLLDARAAYRTLADDAAEVVRDAASLVAARQPDPVESHPPAETDTKPASLPFLPWTRQLGNAVDFLWDTVPQTDAPST